MRVKEAIEHLGGPTAVAKLMGKHYSTVCKWIEADNIPAKNMKAFKPLVGRRFKNSDLCKDYI